MLEKLNQANLVNWKKLLINIAIWGLTEIVLGYVGLDNFADYTEFLQDRHLAPIVSIYYVS